MTAIVPTSVTATGNVIVPSGMVPMADGVPVVVVVAGRGGPRRTDAGQR